MGDQSIVRIGMSWKNLPLWKDEIYKFIKNVAAWINCLDICRNPSRHIFHYDARDYFPSMMPEITSQEWSTHTGCPIKRLPVLACYHCKLLASFYWEALSSKIQDWIQSRTSAFFRNCWRWFYIFDFPEHIIWYH